MMFCNYLELTCSAWLFKGARKGDILEILVYDCLVQEARDIRLEVFVEEQGFQDELDEIDLVAKHFVMYAEDRTPAATCRVFWDEEINGYVLGRLAVRREYRGRKAGAAMMEAVEKYVRNKGGESITLHAQCRASEFYRKQGFVEFGEIGEEEGCPHVWMKKDICSDATGADSAREVIKMLDAMTEAGVSRIKVDISDSVGEGMSRKAYHHGRCDVGSPFATGQLFDLEEE